MPTSTRARIAPNRTRRPGQNRPCTIEYFPRKMPPSASATPPTHTTHWVPKRFSKSPKSVLAEAGGGAAASPGGGLGGSFGGSLEGSLGGTTHWVPKRFSK